LLLTRRRYGDTTFTWVSVQVNGQWVSLGDPWPCITPPKEQLRKQIALTMALQAGTTNAS
jgi:hypothetical protein